MALSVLLCFVLVPPLLFAVYFYKRRSKAQVRALESVADFSIDRKRITPAGGIAVDLGKGRVCVLGFDMEIHVFEASSIIGLELVQDGISVTKASLGSQLGRAAIGGVVLGGAGVVVGALSGTRTTTEQVKNVELLLMVDDDRHSLHRLQFGATGQHEADEWLALLKVMMHRNRAHAATGSTT